MHMCLPTVLLKCPVCLTQMSVEYWLMKMETRAADVNLFHSNICSSLVKLIFIVYVSLCNVC